MMVGAMSAALEQLTAAVLIVYPYSVTDKTAVGSRQQAVGSRQQAVGTVGGHCKLQWTAEGGTRNQANLTWQLQLYSSN